MKPAKVAAAKPQPAKQLHLVNECKAWESGIDWMRVNHISRYVSGRGCDISRIARTVAGEESKSLRRVVFFGIN